MFKKENLRKNFLRVKQIADQNLGRVEKTEVLSDDLQSSEKRVETVKHVTSNTIKKLGVSLLGTGSTDTEKRLKKMPEAILGHCMIESASYLGTECVMGQLYQMCGDCQNNLAQRHLNSELDVEKNVLEPFQAIVDTEIPQIMKLKKALNKVTLDMDSAKSRYNSAVRQTQQPGINMVTASAKVDVVKDELEETSNRVDQAKDAYTTEMFNFMSREADQSQNLLSLIEAQAEYHRKSLEIIDQCIPKMKEVLNCNPTKPVYGIPLEEHLRVSNRDVAQVLEACICFLLEDGLEEEGLFRIAGMASKVKKLKASFDAGVDFEDIGDMDAHTVAGALKQYLRELPEPLLTFKLFPDFMAAAQQQADQRLQALWCVVDRLPKPNYDNFRYLIKFLAKLTERSEVNKMTPGNIAIVIGPNLIWSEGDNGPNMMNTGILSLITELIVQHADWFFPGDQDFHATLRDNAPEHRRRKSSAFMQKPVHSENMAKTTVAMVTAQQQLPSSSQMSRKSRTSLHQKVSQDSVSSSSESTSLSDVSTHMKEYENADTLERRDSVDHYLTARDMNFGVTSPTSDSPQAKTGEARDRRGLERTPSNHSTSSHSTPQSSPAGSQDASNPLGPPQTPPTASRSPSVSPAVSNTNLTGAPLAESEDLHQSVIRRPTRKPAPPPPERPYSVAVCASMKPGEQTAQYQTWPRQTDAPKSDSPANSLSQSDKQKTLPPDRPSPPERVSSLSTAPHHAHVDRPKIPPPVVPPGHQRSASTGAPVTIPGSSLETMDNEQLTELNKTDTL